VASETTTTTMAASRATTTSLPFVNVGPSGTLSAEQLAWYARAGVSSYYARWSGKDANGGQDAATEIDNAADEAQAGNPRA